MTFFPYSGASAFDFIVIFFQRLFSGALFHSSALAPDELQLIILALIASSAAVVGVFLIYRKMTMLTNAFSHSILFGIAITFFILRKCFSQLDLNMNLQVMFIAALITGFLTAYLSDLISRISQLQPDASLGLVFNTLFALGVLLISLFSRNAHIGVELVLGNVDALHIDDLMPTLGMLCINLLLVLVFFRGLKLTTFDPIFAFTQGFRLGFYRYLIIFMLSMTALTGFRAIGVVLILAFFIIPPLIARLYTQSLQRQMILAVLIGILSSFLGVMTSRHLLTVYQLPLSTGGVTVLTLYSLFFINHLFLYIYRRTRKWIFSSKEPNFASIKS